MKPQGADIKRAPLIIPPVGFKSIGYAPNSLEHTTEMLIPPLYPQEFFALLSSRIPGISADLFLKNLTALDGIPESYVNFFEAYDAHSDATHEWIHQWLFSSLADNSVAGLDPDHSTRRSGA
jgi:hypothetical protein